ncbi:hypothetical protein JMJ35_005304 [Cladonia borealis]|uniref:HTH APSES-type domain-containing protein n=1 Tax=Cladonia borealis TaxID=184061 RepID=A0AA39R168_9LECA|nr:hypothetical protein JMJ35_005304 [Cladonia borealis]
MAGVQTNGVERMLPKKRNPMLAPERTPDHAELIKKRRLGQTTLSVKPGLVGTHNSTKPENLGPFDYAHLRAPLPEKLKGSEIFAPHANQPVPEVYFLMRRSSDGFVSATGMFKAAFPWAKHAEESAERDYIKTLPSTAHDEVAGNVWINEHYAIELAEEYGIARWIAALLDDTPILQINEDPDKAISPPPKFKFTANDRTHLPPPNGTPRASTPKSRGRPRAGSPTKNASPAKSSRKARPTKAAKEADLATAREASASLQATLDDVTSTAASESADGEKVRVEVESNVEVKGNTETTTTNVRIEMPKGAPELPLPESPEEMIAKAKEMVEEAKRIDGESSSSVSKRKAEELDEESDEAGDKELQPAKKARLLEEKLKREKVRTRAMIGVAATLAIGAIIPFVLPA